jgi:hypothetical protein
MRRIRRDSLTATHSGASAIQPNAGSAVFREAEYE